MVELYGKTLSRRDVAERCGLLSQVAGVRLMTLGDGVERGVRMLEFGENAIRISDRVVNHGFRQTQRCRRAAERRLSAADRRFRAARGPLMTAESRGRPGRAGGTGSRRRSTHQPRRSA